MPEEAHHAHCLATLRETDRDRYLVCLLSPPEVRGDLAALYAFNAEIARIRDVIREPLAGEIRMQWWRDLIGNRAPGAADGNPIASALLDCMSRHNLPADVLLNLIDARVFDLYDDAMESRTDLEGYAGETASALIQLACLVLDQATAARSAATAGHAGVAQTIAGLLLLLPLHRRRGQVYLPADLQEATGLDRDRFLKGEDQPAVAAAISAFVGLGRDHLRLARQAGGISERNFFAFLPLALTEPVFRRAEAAGARVLDHPIVPPQWLRQWWLWRAARKRRF